jgi:hypothetical protein
MERNATAHALNLTHVAPTGAWMVFWMPSTINMALLPELCPQAVTGCNAASGSTSHSMFCAFAQLLPFALAHLPLFDLGDGDF